MLPFCALVSQIMVRKGWSVQDDWSKVLWKQILMGPRPPPTRWLQVQRGPAPKWRPQQKKERPIPLVQQPKEPTTVEKLTKALSAVDGSSPEAQMLRDSEGGGRFSRTNPCISRRSSFGSSREDCEARGGNHSSGARQFTGENSVGGIFAECQEGGQDDISWREARFLFAIHREGFEEAPVVRSGSRSSTREEVQVRHGEIWRFCEPRHLRQQPQFLRFRTPTEKWSNYEQRLQS